jgi:hypothetical protein
MITEIGIAAGDIWHYLDNHGRIKLEELFSSLDKPRDLLLMSVGWLAREGHVIISEEGKVSYIALRKV